ncbi:MAG: exodeoxyribonuclease VII large subunit [Ruminococcaceae bacterium]|nr:exodeoxyribonuclease VII large subunit [Oscillospiraceae bacterium]
MKIYYSSAAKPSAMSVSQLNNYVKDLLDDDRMLSDTEVVGEISNFKHYLSGGHMYFTLKDEKASVAAVMYKNANQYLSFLPSDGMKVKVRGSVSVYPQSGKYQIYVREMLPDGEGALYKQYELLKAKLFSDGLFDEAHKKALPRIPMKVGIITSKFGAALQDMINVSKRRFPIAELHVFPSAVQGISAHEELIRGIKYFNETASVDVIIIGRGGGSIEDLWAFNNEALAREIFNCTVPVVSAVGHETDFTICDLVSDMRAPTPSAAAELIFPDISEITLLLENSKTDMKNILQSKLENAEAVIDRFSSKKIKARIEGKYKKLAEDIDSTEKNLRKSISAKVSAEEEKLRYVTSVLEARSPLATLNRGYSIITNQNESLIKKISDVSVDMPINIRLSDGKVKAKITEIKNRETEE